MRNKNQMNKKAQLTIFIIVAIVIVVGIFIYILARSGLEGANVPKDLEPVYEYYLNCIGEEALLGATIMESQAGYIEPPEFSPGSSYMPFSNQLDFLGNPVPYWFYVSGNGVIKEQVPNKDKLEQELNVFLEERILECDFSDFSDQGFEIELSTDINVNSKITPNKLDLTIDHDLTISTFDVSWNGNKHFKEVSSNLGMFYNLATKVYSDFKETLFLEEYGVDILRLYAPVDGIEVGCTPKIWELSSIREDLTSALESNVGFIKLKGDYYTLGTEENKYFVHDIGEDVDINVNFIYLRDWPMKMDVWPKEGELLKADPVGLQEGLGMLGFCYVPYHHIYDFAYPVLIQFYSGDEMFQFPVVVYINKNRPREPIDGEGLPEPVVDLCKYKNTELTVYTFDKYLEPIEAEIEFKCLDTSCDIGNTIVEGSEAVLTANFPQCVNGFIIANAEGYDTSREIISSVDSGEISIFLEKEYELEIEINNGGVELEEGDYALVTFTKGTQSKMINYPQQKEIVLTEGQYKIKSYVYSNSKMDLKGEATQQCVDIPKSGVLGVFGLTEEKCFDIEVPDQTIEFAISGGGTQNYFITDSELEISDKVIIEASDFGVPKKVEDLQINFNKVEIVGMEVYFE
jgi:hypothetical protein